MKIMPTNNGCIYIILIFITFLGCKRYKLSEGELEWQPYKIGDILIFESSKKEVDTIKIIKIESYTNPDDPLSILPNFHEILFVSGELLKSNKKEFYYKQVDILSMFASANSTIQFELEKINDTLKYAKAKHTIEEITNMYRENKNTFNELNDVIIIKTDITYSINFDLRNFWWSKKYGYIKYEFKNNYYWKLKQFIRNGKNILTY